MKDKKIIETLQIIFENEMFAKDIVNMVSRSIDRVVLPSMTLNNVSSGKWFLFISLYKSGPQTSKSTILWRYKYNNIGIKLYFEYRLVTYLFIGGTLLYLLVLLYNALIDNTVMLFQNTVMHFFPNSVGIFPSKST